VSRDAYTESSASSFAGCLSKPQQAQFILTSKCSLSCVVCGPQPNPRHRQHQQRIPHIRDGRGRIPIHCGVHPRRQFVSCTGIGHHRPLLLRDSLPAHRLMWNPAKTTRIPKARTLVCTPGGKQVDQLPPSCPLSFLRLHHPIPPGPSPRRIESVESVSAYTSPLVEAVSVKSLPRSLSPVPRCPRKTNMAPGRGAVVCVGADFTSRLRCGTFLHGACCGAFLPCGKCEAPGIGGEVVLAVVILR
jgi:hypothetical protein